MTRKVLILGRQTHPDGKETAIEIYAALKPYFASNDCTISVSYYRDLVFDIAPGNVRVIDTRNNIGLSDYDAVFMTNWFSHASIRKDIAHALGLFFNAKGVTFFNTESLYSRSTSKLSQMMLATLNNVAVPRTIFSLSYTKLTSALKADQHSLGSPFILKDAQASRGQGNYLLKGVRELAKYRAEHDEQHAFMAQSFVASDHSDFRLFITGGKVQFIIRRIGSAESHLHNTSQGAATTILLPGEVEPKVISMAEKMAKLLHREVTGLDVIFDKNTNQAYFLEANPIPQIATGSNVKLKLEALAQALKLAAERKQK